MTGRSPWAAPNLLRGLGRPGCPAHREHHFCSPPSFFHPENTTKIAVETAQLRWRNGSAYVFTQKEVCLVLNTELTLSIGQTSISYIVLSLWGSLM